MAASESQKRRLLGRNMRLKQARDFARVRRDGRRLACGCFIANWRLLPPEAVMRVGVITAKRLGNAVIRARARRLLREAFRLHQHDFAQPVDMVLVAQKPILGQDFAVVDEAFMAMLRKTRLLKTA
jgi:ribonuclease P protein component